MKNAKRAAAVFLVFVLACTLVLSGCGQKTDDLAVSQDNSNAKDASAAVVSDAAKADVKSEVKTDGQKKKVVIVKEKDDVIRNDMVKKMNEALSKGGFNSQNTEIIELKMDADEKKDPELVEKIKQLKPDVILGACEVREATSVIKPLENSGIPVVINAGGEGFVDADGKPAKNITGLYNMPKDMQFSAFGVLNKISPINGKKAVFLTLPGIFKKEDVEANLKKLNIELKDFVEAKTAEDYQAAVKKYNQDNEVGWMLVGVWVVAKKDGSSYSLEDVAKWDRENRKKPSVTYYEIAVQLGMLCGLGVDLPETGAQAAEMAIKILNGEKVENVKAEAPRKINIVLNLKRAEELGVKFPADILGGASKVFTDYEGHFKQSN